MVKATPTEFLGVKFRSKSEAMFALWLQLRRTELKDPCFMTHRNALWTYEPKIDWLPGFSCDFHLCWLEPKDIKCGNFLPVHRFIEYKPTRPTETYCENMLQKFVDACSESSAQSKVLQHQNELLRIEWPTIYFGSVYNEDRGFVFTGPSGIKFHKTDWIGSLQDEILNYRFDLHEAEIS
jgi:hypothetical protein